MKLHFDNFLRKWYVYVHHQIPGSQSFLPRCMRLSMTDTRETIQFLQVMIRQIKGVHYGPPGVLPSQLENPKAKFTDFHDPEFYDPEITDKTTSGLLEMRPFLTSNGDIQIRLMVRGQPRNVIPGKPCLGLTFPLTYERAMWFCKNLKKFLDQVMEQEYEKMVSIL